MKKRPFVMKSGTQPVDGFSAAKDSTSRPQLMSARFKQLPPLDSTSEPSTQDTTATMDEQQRWNATAPLDLRELQRRVTQEQQAERMMRELQQTQQRAIERMMRELQPTIDWSTIDSEEDFR